MQFGAFFSAVGACKKAVDVIKDLNAVPDQAVHLWRMVDSLEPALTLASALLTRSDTSDIIAPALSFCHEVLSACDAVLIRATPEGRPFEAQSWSDWWGKIPSQTKDSISRLQLLPKLVDKVGQCAAVLQLALTTAAAASAAASSSSSSACNDNDGITTRFGTIGTSIGLQQIGQRRRRRTNGNEQRGNLIRTLSTNEDGLRTAKNILYLFEMGRLDCVGGCASASSSSSSSASKLAVYYQLGVGRLFRGADLISMNCVVVLACEGGGGAATVLPSYSLHFLDADEVDELRVENNKLKNNKDSASSSSSAPSAVFASGSDSKKAHRHEVPYTILPGPVLLEEGGQIEGEEDHREVDVKKRQITALATVALTNSGRGNNNNTETTVIPSAHVGKVKESGSGGGGVFDIYANMQSTTTFVKPSLLKHKIIVTLEKSTKRECGGGEKTKSSPTPLHMEFQACSVPAQFVPFPLGNETYYTSTVEAFVGIVLLLGAMGKAKKGQIDEIWPNLNLCEDEDEDEMLIQWAEKTLDDLEGRPL